MTTTGETVRPDATRADGRDDVTNAPADPVVLRHQADILLHKS